MKKTILAMALVALNVFYILAVEIIPRTITLGSFAAPSATDTAVVVMSRNGDYICCYSDSGKLRALRSRGKTPDSLSPIDVDLSGTGIVSVRDIKAFNRFDKEWMVFFVAADAAGNESVRALEFDKSNTLVYSPYKAFDDSTLGGAIVEYQVLNDEIMSFYVVTRKESGVSIAFAAHDPDNRALKVSRQSENLFDTIPVDMLCRKGNTDLEVVVDYSTSSEPAFRSTIAAFRDGSLFARSDLGCHNERIKGFRSYRIDAGSDTAYVVRDSELEIWSVVNGKYLSSKSCAYSGSSILQADIADARGSSFLATCRNSSGVDLQLYNVDKNQTTLIASAPGSLDASACVTIEKESINIFWIARDASKLRSVHRLSPLEATESWGSTLSVVERDAVSVQKSADFLGLLIFEGNKNLGFVELDEANGVLMISVTGNDGLIMYRSGRVSTAAEFSGSSKTTFSIIHDGSTLIARDGERIIYLSEDGTGGVLSGFSRIGNGSYSRALLIRTEKNYVTVCVVEE